MKNYFVYTHATADGQIFYVGAARCYKDQFGYGKQHKRAFASNPRPLDWYKFDWKNKIVEVIEYFDTRYEAFAAEEKLSKQLREEGHPLTNQAAGPGIKGYKDSAKSRQLKAESKRGAANPMYGKTGSQHHNSQKVLDTYSGEEYPSITAAAKAAGYSLSYFHAMLTGRYVNTTSMELL
jgi:hypothetical protein